MLSILTVITFVFAVRAVPISGAFSPTPPLQYPYLDTEAQFPNDYLWMYSAIVMLITYLVYMISIEVVFNRRNKIIMRASVISAQFSAFILITTYFLQAEVLPINIMLDQNNGVSLFTQYNPYGIFIGSEVLGYLFMMLSLLLIASIFNKSKSGKFLRGFLIASFISVVAAYIILSSKFGLEKMERFEVTIICITWLDLIVLGVISFLKRR